MRIVIIDYNMGNIGSIYNMIRKIGEVPIVANKKEEIERADKLILPGVGSFDLGIKNLRKFNLVEVLEKKTLVQQRYILGICLGMQLFTTKSEEGKEDGLGWVEGEVLRFNFSSKKFKIPHMGWNFINIKKHDKLLYGLENSRFYFVHSYYVVCSNRENIMATTVYGIEFVSIFKKNNIIGVQFHPEKSHKYGLKLLENFLKL